MWVGTFRDHNRVLALILRQIFFFLVWTFFPRARTLFARHLIVSSWSEERRGQGKGSTRDALKIYTEVSLMMMEEVEHPDHG